MATRVYRCEDCGMDFPSLEALQGHLRQEHDYDTSGAASASDANYRCPQRGQLFTSQEFFREHFTHAH